MEIGDDRFKAFITTLDKTLRTLNLLIHRAVKAVRRKCLNTWSSKMRGLLVAGASLWLLVLVLIAIPLCLSHVEVGQELREPKDEEVVGSNDLQNLNDNANTTDIATNTTEAPSDTSSTTEANLDVAPTSPSKEVEQTISLSIFFMFLLLGICTILVHLLIKIKFHYLPESIAFVLIGFFVGLVIYVVGKESHQETEDLLRYNEKFSPESFFLILLPPIIFESGYSLHKGNFFQNLGSIVLFAVVGTVISACIVGGGLFALGRIGVVYELTFVQSFAFGALISAVDPVATLAIFHALDVNPTLNMLVFGESVLNDAVSIVMTKTIMEQASSDVNNPGLVLVHSLGQFLLMFFVSGLLGITVALCSALFLKYVKLRDHYSLEFAMWFIFAFGPYFIAEGLHLSGIMAILFSGIVMSHYTHQNLSAVTQITVQQTLRTVAFMAETVVFLYIGMQVFTISTSFKVELIIWSLILILLGRAANIFPLSLLVNRFRSVKISNRMQFVIWFSGLRGAIAYALALNLKEEKDVFATKEVIQVLDTTTLVIVLFTIVIFGGSTLPLLKFLSKGSGVDDVTLSKTEDQGAAASATQEDEHEVQQILTPRQQWFLYFDYKYFKPFLTRRFTKQEVQAGRGEMQRRTNEWYKSLREASSEEEEEEDDETIVELEEQTCTVSYHHTPSSHSASPHISSSPLVSSSPHVSSSSPRVSSSPHDTRSSESATTSASSGES